MTAPRRVLPRPGAASRRRATRLVRFALLAGLAVAPAFTGAFAEVGRKLDPVELPVVGGGKAPLLGKSARANVFVFVRADQDHSVDAVRQAAACEKELGGKGARVVLVVSGSTAPADVKAMLGSAGASLPVLLDEGDKLYDALQIRMHPVAGFADAKGVLQAMEPYRQVDFGDVVRARTRFLLGELDKAGLEAALNPAAAPSSRRAWPWPRGRRRGRARRRG